MYRPYSNHAAGSGIPRSVEDILRNLTQDFAMSFNTGNFDQAAGLFAQDGMLARPGLEAVHGQKLIEVTLRRLSDLGYSDLRLETVRVEHSGDLAMEIGRFTVTLRKPEEPAVTERGSVVKVWRRLGAWLVIADCWSRAADSVGKIAA